MEEEAHIRLIQWVFETEAWTWLGPHIKTGENLHAKPEDYTSGLLRCFSPFEEAVSVAKKFSPALGDYCFGQIAFGIHHKPGRFMALRAEGVAVGRVSILQWSRLLGSQLVLGDAFVYSSEESLNAR
jgi:hypothetical protein